MFIIQVITFSIQIIVSDLSLLSLPRISARLGIPVESITTVVIGIATSIIAAGWLCLFVYYNSCGRPYATTAEKPLIHTIFLKDKFIQTAESDNGGKYFDVQPRDTESNKKKSLKTLSTENDSLRRMQKAIEDTSVKDVLSEPTAVAASASITKQHVTTMDTDQHFDYPISIITRPRRREDLRIHKLESLSDISVPPLKEICMEKKLHPHPIPPTISGILEVRSFTEQMYRNPMNCL
ncbi:putative integral membrane protein [Acanthocheilonema viteae]